MHIITNRLIMLFSFFGSFFFAGGGFIELHHISNFIKTFIINWIILDMLSSIFLSFVLDILMPKINIGRRCSDVFLHAVCQCFLEVNCSSPYIFYASGALRNQKRTYQCHLLWRVQLFGVCFTLLFRFVIVFHVHFPSMMLKHTCSDPNFVWKI